MASPTGILGMLVPARVGSFGVRSTLGHLRGSELHHLEVR
jgi:hypothetical protein